LDKNTLEIKINSKIISLTIEVKELRLIAKPVAPENAIGRISRMDAINNKSINDRMLRKAEEKLKGLKMALSRLKESDFGKCIQCKNWINEQRILLMPEVIKCINCA